MSTLPPGHDPCSASITQRDRERCADERRERKHGSGARRAERALRARKGRDGTATSGFRGAAEFGRDECWTLEKPRNR